MVLLYYRWMLFIANIAYASTKHVQVNIFMEAGCPFCSKYVASPLTHALADEETASMMEVDVSPFGNAYYVPQECVAAATNPSSIENGEYDIGLRNCFFKACGAGVAQRPADCFSGKLICQHGPKECSFNRYFACAKRISEPSNSGIQSYLPFITCMESDYAKVDSEVPSSLVSSCAEVSKLSVQELQSCYDGEAGDDALKHEAMATPEHPGVPWVLVDGQSAKESYEPDALVKAVREASNEHPTAGFLAIATRTVAGQYMQAMC